MPTFNLPVSTVVNRIIPKNSFDRFTTSRQKKSFTDLVDKIRWTNKLSKETINLSGSDITEIQVFEVTLKKKAIITDLLNVIDRAIPYPIIFIVVYDDFFMIATSAKHVHPANENIAVIDWTFTTEWHKRMRLNLYLTNSLDYIWMNFCKQISGRPSDKFTLPELITIERRASELKAAIEKIKTAMKSTRQFNKKVELNLQLQQKQKELAGLI